jgi:DNA-binding response OmpR family regulator
MLSLRQLIRASGPMHKARAFLLIVYSSSFAHFFWMSKHASRRPLVLLLEDEAIIGLNLQEDLQDFGYRVAGPFTTCAAALDWLKSDTPDVAILDAVLKDGPCRDIALELARQGVPFVIYSGHPEDQQLLAEFRHVTWIEKPVPPSVLIEECKHLLVTAEEECPPENNRSA